MAETTLVSSFYSFDPFVAAAHAFSPSRIVLVVAEDSLANKRVVEDVEKVKGVYGKVAVVEVVRVKGSDLLSIALKTVDLLEGVEKPVVVNVSGGWKLLAQGILYGCYARPDLVEKIVCNDLSEGNKLVELPKLSFGLTAAKRELLEAISERNGKSIAQIADKLGKTRGMLYQHLKELKENGYVNEKFEITLAGRMALV